MGCSAGLTFWYEGGRGMVGGRRPPALEIAACMSCAASSILRLRSNWMVTDVAPCELDELICLTPAMVENSRSRGVATDDAMVSGSAPGIAALTWMVG